MKRETRNAKRETTGEGHGSRLTAHGSRITVCVVTGTRAEFGIWRPVLRAMGKSKRLELKLIATGMHLLKEFGRTVREVEAEFRVDATAAMYRAGEVPEKSLARGIGTLGAAYRKTGAEMVMVLGDRLEMLAAASAALACRVPIAHVHGGETAPGIWDEQIRHAITKMAQVHFCATEKAGRRIVQMGETPERVHVVGAPALDLAIGQFARMRAFLQRQPLSVKKALSLPSKDPGPLVLLHPSSGGDNGVEYTRAWLLLRTVIDIFPKMRVQVIGPNNDPGYRGILRAYEELKGEILLDMSMPQPGFWAMMLGCGMLIGNSSSGIIEAASFGIPVVNMGDRQAGRERSGNVIDVPWEGKNGGAAGIERAIRRVLTDKAFGRRVALRKNVYGDGHAAERMVAVLERIAREGISTVKRF